MAVEQDIDGKPIKPVAPLWSTHGLARYTQGEPTDEVQDDAKLSTKTKVPPAGLPKSFWKNLGIGRS